MTCQSDPACIAEVRRTVERIAAEGQFDERTVGELGLCVNEAIANVIRHAYAGAKDRPIVVNVQCQDGELVVTIRDWGNGVNPAELPPRPHDPLKPGGLGLICLREMLSEVRFVPQGDGMMLVMKKRKPAGAKTTERP